MSHQSTHHHHLLLNSVPQTPQQHHHHHHQPNLTAPIKHENDSDDDVVSLPTVPKVLHSPDEYDSECQCSTCQLVTKLLACTCEQCKGTRQLGNSSENVSIFNAVSPTNGQPSSSSSQNNDASTSEHTNANDLDDDRKSRSSTPNYLPRFFDDESGDSSSDDSEHEDSVDDGDDSCDNMEVDKESLNSIAHSQPSTSCRNAIVTNVDKSNLIDNGSTNSNDESTDLTPDKCPKCAKTFSDIHKLLHHYRGFHQEWNPNYCRWLSEMKLARKHDKINSKYTNEHLIKVDPKTSKTTKLRCLPRKQRKVDNSDNSENEDSSSDDDGSSEM